MPHQSDMFSDELSDAQRQPDAFAVSLKLTGKTDRLSSDQKRFNKLLERIDQLKSQLIALQEICDAHRPVYLQKLAPLRERRRILMREMVLGLDKRLQRKGLTASQKRLAAMILCNLSWQLAAQGDEEMKILHDKHSRESLAQIEQNAMDEMRLMMEDALGEPLSGEESLDTVQDVFRAGMKRLREAEEAEKEARRAKARRKKPSAAQLKAQADQEDADFTLRKVFRQLASALHPDRENDPEERARKTALMSEANAAYERRDLVTLLQIQLRTELTDTASIAKMAEEKIASLTILLKQQVHELEAELYNRRHTARQEFGLNFYETLSVAALQRGLVLEEVFFQNELAAMQQDLQQMADDQYFKRWLKDQSRMANAFPDDAFMD